MASVIQKYKGVDPRPFSAHLTFLGDGLVGEMAWMLFDPPQWVLVEEGGVKRSRQTCQMGTPRKTNMSLNKKGLFQ